MKQKQSWFQLYPESNRASNLSIAGGAVRLLSLLFLIAAIGATLVLLLAGARLTAAAGVGTALIFLLDELGEGVFLAFFLWGAVLVCRYAACVLQSKAELLARPDHDFLRRENLFAPTREQFEHWPAGPSPLARAFHVYARQFMLDDILVKVDRCSMLHSLEVRAPFLDKDFAEYVARLPIRHKLHGFQRKYLLKKAFTDVLPPEILHRNKRGFQIPVAAWLRGRMRPLMEELFAPERLRAQGLFRPEAVRSLVDAHCSGKADLRKPLWTLLVLQLWLRARGM